MRESKYFTYLLKYLLKSLSTEVVKVEEEGRRRDPLSDEEKTFEGPRWHGSIYVGYPQEASI